jgi:branched-chain amino acid transport system substrate-binding protein
VERNISGTIFVAGTVTMLACFAPGAEPQKIGMVAPLSGPSADSGRYQIQGTELATDEVNKAGGVLGRQIELVMEDDQTTNPGGLQAFRLSENKSTLRTTLDDMSRQAATPAATLSAL